jgi:hypothetical protein
MVELFIAVPVGCVNSANPQALNKQEFECGGSFLTTAVNHKNNFFFFESEQVKYNV